MSTINKYRLSKYILEDIGTLELWILAKQKSLVGVRERLLTCGDEMSFDSTINYIREAEDDIADRQRQLQLLKVANGVIKKL